MGESTPEAVAFTVKTLRDRAEYHQLTATEHLGTATQTVGAIHQIMAEDYNRLADELSTITDEALAFRYFDEHRALSFSRDGLPPEGVEYLRKQYVRAALANPEAMRQLREEAREREARARDEGRAEAWEAGAEAAYSHAENRSGPSGIPYDPPSNPYRKDK